MSDKVASGGEPSDLRETNEATSPAANAATLCVRGKTLRKRDHIISPAAACCLRQPVS